MRFPFSFQNDFRVSRTLIRISSADSPGSRHRRHRHPPSFPRMTGRTAAIVSDDHNKGIRHGSVRLAADADDSACAPVLGINRHHLPSLFPASRRLVQNRLRLVLNCLSSESKCLLIEVCFLGQRVFALSLPFAF